MSRAAFSALLRAIKAERNFPSSRAFAAAMEMDEGHFSKVLRGRAGPLGLEACLRLAALTATYTPADILRAADMASLADRLERLYGPYQPSTLTLKQRDLLTAFEQLPAPVQDHILDSLTTITAYLKARTLPPSPPRRAVRRRRPR